MIFDTLRNHFRLFWHLTPSFWLEKQHIQYSQLCSSNDFLSSHPEYWKGVARIPLISVLFGQSWLGMFHGRGQIWTQLMPGSIWNDPWMALNKVLAIIALSRGLSDQRCPEHWTHWVRCSTGGYAAPSTKQQNDFMERPCLYQVFLGGCCHLMLSFLIHEIRLYTRKCHQNGWYTSHYRHWWHVLGRFLVTFKGH